MECRLEVPGIKPPTFWFVGDPLYSGVGPGGQENCFLVIFLTFKTLKHDSVNLKIGVIDGWIDIIKSWRNFNVIPHWWYHLFPIPLYTLTLWLETLWFNLLKPQQSLEETPLISRLLSDLSLSVMRDSLHYVTSNSFGLRRLRHPDRPWAPCLFLSRAAASSRHQRLLY